MKLLTLALLLMVLVIPVGSQSTPALCDIVDFTSTGEAQVWDDVRKAYPNTPNDLYWLDTLYLDDPRTTAKRDAQGYLLFYSQETGELWIFPMWSMETPDNSNPPGYTCAPRRYALNG